MTTTKRQSARQLQAKADRLAAKIKTRREELATLQAEQKQVKALLAEAKAAEKAKKMPAQARGEE
jgi:hypothetical protein